MNGLYQMAMLNAMGDSTFRKIMGLQLLADENKANDGIGLALLTTNYYNKRGLRNGNIKRPLR